MPSGLGEVWIDHSVPFQDSISAFCDELRARRDFFYEGIRDAAGQVFSGEPPRGAFYAFLRIHPD